MASATSLAIRTSAAMDRITAALGDSVNVHHKQTEVKAVLQVEAIAEALESMGSDGFTAEQILSVEGLSKTSTNVLSAFFGVESD